MFLTRSIRRKLVIGLGLVLMMLLMLGGAGLLGLLSYRSVVHDLQASLETEPRRTDLAGRFATLFEPLLGDRTHERQELQFNPVEWSHCMAQANEELSEYRRRVVELPQTPDVVQRAPVIHSKLDQIQQTLAHLDRDRQLLDSMPLEREVALDRMLRDVARIQIIIQDIPNSERGLAATLRDASLVYRWSIWAVIGCSIVVVLLLIGLFRCGYAWIFVPVRKLHEAASRVAHGDFKHRLHLKGRDEMVDLGNSFNRMIERFQRDKEEVDQEVRARGEQLVQTKQLVDLGFIASGIAHEINNPLAAIAMAAESLTDRMKEQGDRFGGSAEDRELLRTYLDMILREAFRCQQITTRTLEFARGNDAPRLRHDMTKIVGEVLDMIRHMSRFRGFTIEFDQTRPHPAEVNAGEIKQVVINLLSNALEAMEGMGKGKVTIELTDSVDEVILSVRDTGCGMTPHVLSHMYKPFFTEKASGKGTGLGLSIVHRIVGEHSGRIEAASEGPGRGSTFRVYLPRRAQEISHAA